MSEINNPETVECVPGRKWAMIDSGIGVYVIVGLDPSEPVWEINFTPDRISDGNKYRSRKAEFVSRFAKGFLYVLKEMEKNKFSAYGVQPPTELTCTTNKIMADFLVNHFKAKERDKGNTSGILHEVKINLGTIKQDKEFLGKLEKMAGRYTGQVGV